MGPGPRCSPLVLLPAPRALGPPRRASEGGRGPRPVPATQTPSPHRGRARNTWGLGPSELTLVPPPPASSPGPKVKAEPGERQAGAWGAWVRVLAGGAGSPGLRLGKGKPGSGATRGRPPPFPRREFTNECGTPGKQWGCNTGEIGCKGAPLSESGSFSLRVSLEGFCCFH